MATRDEVVAWLDQTAEVSKQMAVEWRLHPDGQRWYRDAVMASEAARLLRQPGDGLAAYGLVGDG